jgi:hypothetical protein
MFLFIQAKLDSGAFNTNGRNKVGGLFKWTKRREKARITATKMAGSL